MNLELQTFLGERKEGDFAEMCQFLPLKTPFIAEKPILEKHKIVWKAFKELSACLNEPVVELIQA